MKKTDPSAPRQTGKRRPLRILLRILAGLLILLLCLALALYIIPLTETEDQKTVEGSADWMGRLEGSLRLHEIVLPGTHDSATKSVQLAFFSKCQALTVGEQLEAGFRYLDIRLGSTDEGRLKLVHGFTSCKTGDLPWSSSLYLEEVLDQCYAFLEAHPTETVVFAVKQEQDHETAAEFAALLEAELAKNPARWYTGNTIPTLDEVRGRLVLFRRYADGTLPEDAACAGIPMIWADQGGHGDTGLHAALTETGGLRLWVQDRYCYGTEDKWTAFLAGLREPEIRDGDLAIHFLSTKGTFAYGHPYSHARTLNRKLQDLSLEALRGWIIVDFGNAPLAEHIYAANFR